MGYTIDAEYTLELLNEPKSYEYIAQRFFCTGFILATRVDEHAITAIMRSWREIDEVTSDRLRFLFFIDNETTLTGWPNYPHFTEKGYRRNNQELIGEARSAHFTLNVTPGVQSGRGFDGSRVKNREPEHRVRKLAQSLGVASMLPCLVWSPHERGEIFVEKLVSLDSNEIVGAINGFCNQFYDKNVVTIGEISAIESEVERACRGLYLTLSDFEQIIALGEESTALRDLIASLSRCPMSGLCADDYLKDYHDVAKRAVDLAKSWPDADIRRRLGASVHWSYYARTRFSEIGHGATINVPQTAELIWEAWGLVDAGASLAPRFDPLHSLPQWEEIIAVAHLLRELEREGALASLPTQAQINRWIEYVANQSSPESKSAASWEGKTAIVTSITAYKLLESALAIGDSRVETATGLFRSRVTEFVRDCAHATVATLQIHIFYAARDRLFAVSEEMKRLNAEGDEGRVFSNEIKNQLPSMIRAIDAATLRLNWPSLGGLKKLPLPPSLPIAIDRGAIEGDPFKALTQLRAEVERSLTPVGKVLHDLREAHATIDEMIAERIALDARHLIIVQAGATVQVAEAINNTNIERVQTGGVSISGTIGDIHGDIVGGSKGDATSKPDTGRGSPDGRRELSL